MATTPMQDPTQQQPDPTQMQQQLQRIAQTPPQPVPQAGPDQGSPVRRFLTNFFYGAGQAALQHVGLPTDYEKQQNVIQQNQRQQAINQQAAEASSLVGLHQQQLQNEKQTYAQNEYENQQVPVTPDVAQFYPGQQTIRRKDYGQALQISSALKQKQPIDIPDELADAGGLPRGSQTDPRYLPILGKMAALKGQGWQNKDENGLAWQINKYTNETRPVLDPKTGQQMKSNAMLTPYVRAQANAAYRPFQAMDDQGNPTTISAQQALNTGAPLMSEKASMNLASDRTGVGQFLNNNEFFRGHMNVLDDMTQRGLIARATREAEGNPGAAKSILEGYTQQGMTPEASEFASRLLNQREMSGVLRKYTGNGGSTTDSLRAIVNSNLPGASRSKALNNALLDRDQQLANGVLQNLSRPSAYAPKARTPQGAATPSAGSGGAKPDYVYVPGKGLVKQ